MSLLDRFRNTPELKGFFANQCVENGVSAVIDKVDDYIIIKLDWFYKSLNLGNETPKSPDCLVVQKCKHKHGYKVILVELKDFKSSNNIKLDSIKDKFYTALYDFMDYRFKDLFRDILGVQLILVTSNNHYKKKDISLKYDTLINNPIKWRNRPMLIRPAYSIVVLRNC